MEPPRWAVWLPCSTTARDFPKSFQPCRGLLPRRHPRIRMRDRFGQIRLPMYRRVPMGVATRFRLVVFRGQMTSKGRDGNIMVELDKRRHEQSRNLKALRKAGLIVV